MAIAGAAVQDIESSTEMTQSIALMIIGVEVAIVVAALCWPPRSPTRCRDIPKRSTGGPTGPIGKWFRLN